jgi:hypothetical protein
MPRVVLAPSLRVYAVEAEIIPINVTGRPSLFKRENVRIGYNLALMGASDTRMAAAFGVNVETFYQWKRQFPHFSEALRDGKDIADANVARSMYEQAIGYWGPDDKWYPPNLGAQKHWLANRQRNRWASVVEPEPANVSVTINTADPNEASRQYRAFISGEPTPLRLPPGRIIDAEQTDDE